MEKKLEILIVEDNEKNRKAAQTAIERDISLEDGEVIPIYADIVSDYKSALDMLKRKKYSGIISDLFFPREIGSRDKDLGMKVVKDVDIYHREILLEEIRSKGLGDVSFDDIPSRRELLEMGRFDQRIVDSADSPDLFSVFREIGEEKWRRMRENVEARMRGENVESLSESLTESCTKPYASEAFYLVPKLRRYILDGDESCQPLGSLIAEEAYQRKIPIVIFTSESGHGNVGAPVLIGIQDRISKNYGVAYSKPERGEFDFLNFGATGEEPVSYNSGEKDTPKEWNYVLKILYENIKEIIWK